MHNCPGVFVICLFCLTGAKYLRGGVAPFSSLAFTRVSETLQKRPQLEGRLCCLTGNVSIDTVLHLTPTELHNLAMETGTNKSAYMQKHWHTDTPTFLTALP